MGTASGSYIYFRCNAVAVIVVFCVYMFLAVPAYPFEESEPRYFDIPQSNVAKALKKFALQAGRDILFSVELVRSKKTAGVEGEYTEMEALQKLLWGTGLNFKQTGENVFLIYEEAVAEDEGQPESREKIIAERRGAGPYAVLEEVKVTGSHIRGVYSASPMLGFDRVDIEKTGVSTSQDFIRTLGQHFRGGVSEHNANFPIAGVGRNDGRGAGVNLRGLDSDSTLVLLNGHRFAPAGFGNFADISLIPLTAVERIEILTDGASAIYGTDAVGGVVNFHMRDKYEGTETRIRYGTVTKGDYNEVQVGNVWGKSGLSGHALISYEYLQHGALEAADRSFTEDVIGPYSLLPEQGRHSVFTSGAYELTDNFKIFGNAYFSRRNNDDFQSLGQRTDRTKGETEQVGALLGIQVPLSDSWQLELAGMYSRNKTVNASRFLDTGEFSNNRISNTSFIESIDALVDGVIPDSMVGEIRIATGVQYRREGFEDRLSLERTGVEADTDREIAAIFGEVFVPVIGKDNSRGGIERLEFTLAFRHEDYSDFGTTTNPKVGLLWHPFTGVSLRATYGTSFRAPLFSETIENNIRGFLIDSIPDAESNTPLTLFVSGNNPFLEPETATTWTAGLDVFPSLLRDTSLSITYFNIEYKNRIETLAPRSDALTNPQYTPAITTRSSPAFDPELIDFVASQPLFLDFTEGELPSNADVIVDLRLRNMSRTMVEGFDFMLDYDVDKNNGESWDFTLNGTYLIRQEKQLFKTASSIDVDGTVFNPPNLRLRGGVSWSRKALAVNMFVNHTGSYKDNRAEPTVKVNSWTTLDFNISYDFGMGSTLLDNSIFSMNVENLLDKDPPSVQSVFQGINFDPNNATALGRFVSLTIVKKW